jgi:hypothetical protein
MFEDIMDNSFTCTWQIDAIEPINLPANPKAKSTGAN